MSTAPAPDALRECAEAFAHAASRIRDDQLGAPTPCEKFTVAGLLEHLGEVLPASARAARKEPQPGGDRPTAAPASPHAVARAAEQAAAAWARPGAHEGSTEFGPGEMPAAFAATITLQELALHGWDLARAAGTPFELGDDAAKSALAAVEQLAEGARASGSYGPPLSVAPDASPWHRALAASGRNPEWTV